MLVKSSTNQAQTNMLKLSPNSARKKRVHKY